MATIKEIIKRCPTCSFYSQTLLTTETNPKGTQRNDIWQMDVFHFAEFGKLKYEHHTTDTYSGFRWAIALSSEKADSAIICIRSYGHHGYTCANKDS